MNVTEHEQIGWVSEISSEVTEEAYDFNKAGYRAAQVACGRGSDENKTNQTIGNQSVTDWPTDRTDVW